MLEPTDICIAVKERLTKDSGVASDGYYDNIVKKLATKPNSKGMFLFVFLEAPIIHMHVMRKFQICLLY